ncbi:MAG: ABC transporter ATP-binding protein/permease [Oscillospiraceae bacterium]|nr:ABC transporter ATP-binding protein/permease [Oscillospiraceae bacterium]MCL2278516.1 ABC transporter ATP-binding protein/permease [Oscillospiraceae bacterium]
MSNLTFVLSSIRRYSRGLLPLGLLNAVMGALVPFAGIFLPMIALSLLVDGAFMAQIVLYIGGYTLLLVLLHFLNDFSNRAWRFRINDISFGSGMDLRSKNLGCDYSYLEDPKSQNLYTLILQNLSNTRENCYIQVALFGFRLITGVLGFILFSFVLTGLNIWVVLLLTTTAIANYLVSRWANRYEHKNKDNWSPIEKKIAYIIKVTGNYDYGKDLRLYNMKPWFMSIAEGLFKARSDWDNKVQSRFFVSKAVGALTVLVRDGAAYAFLIYMVVQGSVGIAEFILYFGAIAGFSVFVTNMIEGISEIGRSLPYASDMRKYLSGGFPEEPIDPLPATWTESGVAPKIEIKNVSFSYTSEQKILENLSLTINSGEKIALVGINGAGKTTIVKLLCGFLAPSEGEILLDGESIKKYRKADIYALFSAVFQDEFILPLSIAENIAPNIVGDGILDPDDVGDDGNLPADTDDERQTNQPPASLVASLNHAGLWDYISQLPEGINSRMTKKVKDEGVILSGGQNQKLFLARALHKNAPILILDEPTAALDPIAESEIYESYHELTSAKTSIFISHRLASTRFCDKVILLEGGKIIESGTHDELIALGGEYAKMYEIQSHYYREGSPQ